MSVLSDFKIQETKQLLQNRGVQWGDTIRIVEVGSTAHGISTTDTGDDYDYTVVRVEDFRELVVGDSKRQSMMIRTQPEGHMSRMGDIDLQVYTLRKFAMLASRGNPSILTAIYSTKVHKDTSGVDWDELGRVVTSRAAGDAFLGYMQQQIERWLGIRGQKNVNRPELVEAYGFDTKYAAHVIRLGHQGIEYMENGRFQVPLDKELAKEIIGLRTGAMKEYDAMEWAKDTETKLKQAIADSDLPPHPATPAVKRWIVKQYNVLVTG